MKFKTRQRPDGWIAFLTDNPDVQGAGQNEIGAIEKLVVSVYGSQFCDLCGAELELIEAPFEVHGHTAASFNCPEHRSTARILRNDLVADTRRIAAFQPNAISRSNSGGVAWYPPDHHNFQPSDRLAELHKPSPGVCAVTLYDMDGAAHTGFAYTVREAYREADHERRRERHTIEGLLRKRRGSVRRELDYRDKLRLAGHCLDMTVVNFEGELDALRDEKEDLERELTDVRTAKIKAERELRGKDERIRQLERDGIEKDKGMTLIRQALEEAGITGGNLIERVRALAAERDQYKAAVQQNTAATAAS